METAVAAPVVALACGQAYFAGATAEGGSYGASVFAWTAPAAKPLFLGGHRSRVSALAFSDEANSKVDGRPLLCTGSREALVLWRIERAYALAADGSKPTGTLLTDELEDAPRALAFDAAGARIAACVGRDVSVYDIATNASVRLEGHGAAVAAARFLPGAAGRVATASEDRSVRVWDLDAGACVWDSGVLCASPLCSLACDSERPRLAVGAEDGRVFVLEAAAGGAAALRLVHTVDAARAIRDALAAAAAEADAAAAPAGPQVISAQPAWRRSPQPAAAPAAGRADDGGVDEAVPALALAFWRSGPAPRPPSAAAAAPALPSAPAPPRGAGARAELLVGSARALLRLDAATFDPEGFFLAAEPLPGPDGGEGAAPGPLAAWALLQTSHADLSYCAAPAFRPAVVAGRIRRRLGGAPEAAGGELSMWPRGPLPADSPLRSELADGAGGAKKGAAGKGKGKGGDKPVTFHSRVKSSGYSAAPWSVQKAAADRAKRAGAAAEKGRGVGARQYPVACGPLVAPLEGRTAALHSAPIARLAYSPDGKVLATCSADRTARTVRGRAGEGGAHVGHDGPLLACHLSFDTQKLLTAAADCTARLWSVGDGRAEPWLVFRHVARSPEGPAASPAAGGAGGAGPVFASAVRAAQFYYLDKFVLLASGPRVHLYKWRVEAEAPDDIQRLRAAGRYKLVTAVQLEAAQAVTALAAPNSFLSNLVLAAGSDRAVAVLDMAHGGAVARLVPDAHGRPVHALAVREASPFATLPPPAYDMFLTSAPDSSVRLWDLRADRCAARFTGHACRSAAAPVGAAFSPCERFVACGSEDRAGYIYDMRTTSVVGRLLGHGDTVSDVAFSPAAPILATACFDGRLRFFGEQEGA